MKMRLLPAVLLTFATSWIASGQTYTISTFAGGGLPGNIPGTSASLYGPQAVAVDRAGNIFFGDGSDVLRLDAATGVLTLVAGNGTPGLSGDNGPATSAQLHNPTGVAVDSAGNLYIADSGNNRIRKVSSGVITTVAGSGTPGYGGDKGLATSAQLNGPFGVAVDSAGNLLYIADSRNNRIRQVSNGVITTVAGNGTADFGGDKGPATNAQLNSPAGVAVDSAGNLYIADTWNNCIRRVSNGVITTVAGNGTADFGGDNGPATSAQLYNPTGVAMDSTGNLYIADMNNDRIRKVSGGVITTVAGGGTSFGDNGPATSAQLNGPADVAVDSAGNLYIADSWNNRIRKVVKGVIATVAGGGTSLGDNGPASSAQLNDPSGVAVDSAGNLYIADTGNCLIRKVANGVIGTVAGNGTCGFSGDNGPATSAQLNGPSGVAVDSAGNLYIADTSNNRIRKVSSGVIATVAGNGTPGFSGNNSPASGGDGGPATSAMLNGPSGVAVDSAGKLFIADTWNNCIRQVSNGVITTVAGLLGGPYYGVAIDSAGNLYIAGGDSILRRASTGAMTTVAGGGSSGLGDNGPATSAALSEAVGVAVDSAGSLFIADFQDNRIREVSNGVITTVAGNGTSGFSGDNGPATSAQLDSPQGVAVDSAGNLYIADSDSNRIRLLTPAPTIFHGGVVPIDSSISVIQPGSWVTIYGNNLASGTFLWNGDFPTSLGGTSVTINSKPAYLWFVSPSQINLQAPDDTATGLVSVVVTSPSGRAASTVRLSPYGPSFSLFGDGKHVAGVIPTPDGTGAYGGGTYDLLGPSGAFSFKTRPVKAGETLVLYGVGFGPTTPSVPAGGAFSGAAPTNSPVAISIGGVPAVVAFAGITAAGLYQFNLTVPPNTGSGDRALEATVNGVQTPPGPVVSVQ